MKNKYWVTKYWEEVGLFQIMGEIDQNNEVTITYNNEEPGVIDGIIVNDRKSQPQIISRYYQLGVDCFETEDQAKRKMTENIEKELSIIEKRADAIRFLKWQLQNDRLGK